MSIYESGEGEGGGGGSMVEESLTAKGGGGAQIACHPALQQKETQQKLAIVVSLVGGLALLAWALSDAEEAYNPHPITPTTTGPNGEIIFIPEGQARKLSAGMEHAAVALPLDYMVQFDLTPHDALVTEWADIIHFTSTGNNCCDYGDRVPGVWFNPGSRKFIVVDGHGGLDHNVQGNDVCQIDEELQPHQKYRIRIEMRQKFVEVWMALCTGSSCAAEELRCTEPREDRIAFPHAQVFASDTFYEPADAEIDNFFMTTLEPVAGCTDFSACNHNPRASEDDGSCRRPVNMVCSQQHRVTTKMCQQAAPPPPPSQVYRPSSGQQYRPPPPPAIGGVGTSVGACVPCGGGYQQPGSQFGGQVSHCGSRTEFIPEGQPFRLVRGVMEGAEQQHWATPAQQGYGGYGEALHAIVPVPTDYTVSFDITPDAQMQEDWSCIVHFTATGNNCCEYGDRAPGIWFHPNSHQVVVVDGQPSDGNARCTPSDALPPNQKTNIQVDMGKVHMEVTFTFADGRIATCEGVRKNRRQFSTVHVWAGDPFYEPALATIENFWMQENSPRAGCMIDAACNRNFKASRPDGSCTYPSPGIGCNGHSIQVDAATGITHFLGAQETFNLQTDGIQRPHHDTVFIPLDYRVQFDVTPDSGVLTNTERSGAWGSLFHFTATGANCCEYGDRVPAVWFYPQSRRLHIVHGQKDSGNNHCSPEEQIPAGVATSVRIDIRQTHVEVWYKQGLSGQWQQRCTEKRTETHTWSPAHMYMPDPWHDPAMASLSNFFIEALEPVRGCTDVMACNYDEHAAIDDGNCHLPQRGEDCRGTQIGSTDGSGTTTFVRAGQQMQLNPCKQQTQTWGDSVDDSESLTGFGNGCFHAVVTLPQDFVLSFEITPHNTQEQWAGITHFTSTGDNCCAYGDRIPGIWFFPGSTKLCVADGQPSDGNDYYTHEQPLPLNRPSRIRLDILQATVTLVINDVVVWHEARTDRARFPHAHVFAPDPWYVPALATISDFKMQAQ